MVESLVRLEYMNKALVAVSFLISLLVAGVLISGILNTEPFRDTLLAQVLRGALPVIGVVSIGVGLWGIFKP